MLVSKVVQFAVLAAAILWDSNTDAATSTLVKFCDRQLGDMMSRVCRAYNSPSWDIPTVVEQPDAGVTVRRQRSFIQDYYTIWLGNMADECCITGCTWVQLSEYCSIRAYSSSPLEDLEAHIITVRSAEQDTDTRGVKGSAGAGAVTATGTAAEAVVGAGYTGIHRDIVIQKWNMIGE